MIPRVLRWVAVLLIAVMVVLLATSDTTPNYVAPRIIIALLMIITSYVIDIKELLERSTKG